MAEISQGDILSVEKIKFPVLVVSKDFFNSSKQIIACPVYRNAAPDPLHIPINTDEIQGTVLCEQMKLLDMRLRGHRKLGELNIEAVMDIADAIQGIFDYYPYNAG